jgi:hypothetical protein
MSEAFRAVRDHDNRRTRRGPQQPLEHRILALDIDSVRRARGDAVGVASRGGKA